MNKSLKEASREEVSKAYLEQVPFLISKIRKNCYQNNGCFVDMRTGEINSRVGFNRFAAKKANLGFEYSIWESNKARKLRLSKRVSKIVLSKKAQFLTLTFAPSYFERVPNAETRRTYIRRFLKEQCSDYVANIDFGEDNGREHYHAIVIPKNEFIDYQPYCDTFEKSRIYAEHVKVNGKSVDNISKYINKLTNHALKENGQYKRLIYSRK